MSAYLQHNTDCHICGVRDTLYPCPTVLDCEFGKPGAMWACFACRVKSILRTMSPDPTLLSSLGEKPNTKEETTVSSPKPIQEVVDNIEKEGRDQSLARYHYLMVRELIATARRSQFVDISEETSWLAALLRAAYQKGYFAGASRDPHEDCIAYRKLNEEIQRDLEHWKTSAQKWEGLYIKRLEEAKEQIVKIMNDEF